METASISIAAAIGNSGNMQPMRGTGNIANVIAAPTSDKFKTTPSEDSLRPPVIRRANPSNMESNTEKDPIAFFFRHAFEDEDEQEEEELDDDFGLDSLGESQEEDEDGDAWFDDATDSDLMEYRPSLGVFFDSHI